MESNYYGTSKLSCISKSYFQSYSKTTLEPNKLHICNTNNKKGSYCLTILSSSSNTQTLFDPKICCFFIIVYIATTPMAQMSAPKLSDSFLNKVSIGM